MLINNLLDYSRLDAGTVKPKWELASFDAAVAQIFHEVLPLAQKHGHKLELNTPQKLPLIYMDKAMVRAIFNNLLSNAIKYTPEGGKIYVTLTEEEDNICTEVKDTGIGIAEEDLDKIFEPFHLTDISKNALNKSAIERTGLGLAIVNEYVKLHGGTIWAESRIGEGSTFHVVFPKNKDEINMKIKS